MRRNVVSRLSEPGQTPSMHTPRVQLPDPLLTEAYEQAAVRNVLAAINHSVFYGYWSVCADGAAFGGDTTFPGLDWGQSAEALLWLDQVDVVKANWAYVRRFQRPDGFLPFAISPSQAGQRLEIFGYPMEVEPSGGIYRHWCPGDPFRTLANVTFLQVGDAIYRHTLDRAWLEDQASHLRLAVQWLETLITAEGLVAGCGFYLERPVRMEYDGVNQAYTMHALSLAAGLFDVLGDDKAARRCRDRAGQITTCFRQRFWAGDRCVEYIHPQRGSIASHGLTDVDWIAVASGIAGGEQIETLWPQLRDNADFCYQGMPTGIATEPQRYEDWEIQSIDRHDVAAMGRVWYLEAWARARRGDGEGLAASLRHVAEMGRTNGWHWRERYYSAKTGDLARNFVDQYCEYPANLIRIVQRFLFGVERQFDDTLAIAPTVPERYWHEGFGQDLCWGQRRLSYRMARGCMNGTFSGGPLRLRVRLALSARAQPARASVNGSPLAVTRRDGWTDLVLPRQETECAFEVY